MIYLNLDEGRKSLVTRLVKETFPGVYLREKKMGQKQYPLLIN